MFTILRLFCCFCRQQSSSSLSSCSTTPEISHCLSSKSLQTSSKSVSNQRISNGKVPNATVKDKRNSNLADILSDHENQYSSLENLPTTDNKPIQRKNQPNSKKTALVNKRPKSNHETKVKAATKVEGKKTLGRSLSATERPDVGMEEAKKVVDSVKMSRKMKDREKIPQSSPKLIHKKS